MSPIPRHSRVAVALISFGLHATALAQVPASRVRDSSGVRIVESARPLWTAAKAWSLSSKPVLLVGDRSRPEYSFSRIGPATRLTDGRIVVAERADMHLRVFDSTGRHLQTIGGKGSRPGEFTDIGAIMRLPGDSLAVESIQFTSIFGPDGKFIRQVRYGPFAPGVLQVPFVAVIGRFADGTAVVGDFPQGRRGARAGSARFTDSSTLLLVEPAGAVLREVDRVPAASFGASVGAPLRLTFGPEMVQASVAGHVFLGFGDEYALKEYDASWTLKRIVRRTWKPRPLSRADITSYVDEWMTLWSTDKGPMRDRDRLAKLNAPFPDALPAFVDFLASPTGELWLRDPELKGAASCACLTSVTTGPSNWTVFDANGRWLGSVRMPVQFMPAEVGRDYVLGQLRDADGLLQLAMYRIIKPR